MESPVSAKISLDCIPAFEAWAANASLRGKTMQDAMRKAMRFAIDFLIAKTKKGDRQKIKDNLTSLTEEYQISEGIGTPRTRIKSAAATKYRGTIAAAMVYRLNYKGARADAAAKSPLFYTKVAKFASGRLYAANLHAAGFKPAQRELRGQAAGVRLPQFHQPPGSISQKFDSDTVAKIIVENWASSAQIPGLKAPLGAAGIIGDRIREVVPELQVLFERFLAEDLMTEARKAGLKPKKS